jgi:hypothetical protein
MRMAAAVHRLPITKSSPPIGLGIYWLGGGLAMVWSSFLLTSPITSFLIWPRVRSTLAELKLTAVYP